jgi:DNA polymerase-4
MSFASSRRIIHVDMDAFFASVEQRDNPEYQGKPLIVGGSPSSRGVVAACSYEARKFGVRSAMPCSAAYRLCPQAIFVKPRFEQYRETSQKIQAIFRQFTHIIEPLSLDEAYLDVSDVYQQYGAATTVAKIIRQKIYDQVKLTASAGISYNKFLAKTASDMNKPNGQFVVTPEQSKAFIATLPIGRFFGVGKVTEAKMQARGIQSGADLQKRTREELVETFGRVGEYYFQIAQGIDEREVRVNRVRKSLGKERTFSNDLVDKASIQETIDKLVEQVYQQLNDRELLPKTLTLKVRYSDFTTITRSLTDQNGFQSIKQFSDVANSLLDNTECGSRPVRLLGLTASNFFRHQAVATAAPNSIDQGDQLTLF